MRGVTRPSSCRHEEVVERFRAGPRGIEEHSEKRNIQPGQEHDSFCRNGRAVDENADYRAGVLSLRTAASENQLAFDSYQVCAHQIGVCK